MRVTGKGGAGQTGGIRGGAGGKPAASGFSVSSGGAAPESRPAARLEGAVAVSSVGALLALQMVGDPLERRRRATSRGGRLLDMLDEVKLGLLSGGVNGSALEQLSQTVREGRESADDPALDGLLKEIETRAAVELAKLEAFRAS